MIPTATNVTICMLHYVNKVKLHTHKARTQLGKTTTHYAGASLWNNLDHDFTKISDATAFRKLLAKDRKANYVTAWIESHRRHRDCLYEQNNELYINMFINVIMNYVLMLCNTARFIHDSIMFTAHSFIYLYIIMQSVYFHSFIHFLYFHTLFDYILIYLII